ncbi:hypothetical protein GCM10023196_085300 [Actinoallomurus vinaceus]|uniref:Uncharacterized protein n=1 Tax=Actinoallomurus vinaceus TaxID=1080074 RepID=A0ABP8UPG6_9ACTN
MYIVLAVIVALFIGARSERARQAHRNWGMYKARLAEMRGLRMRETARAIFGIVALLAMIVLVSGIGG